MSLFEVKVTSTKPECDLVLANCFVPSVQAAEELIQEWAEKHYSGNVATSVEFITHDNEILVTDITKYWKVIFLF